MTTPTPTTARTGGVLAATCLSTLVVNANTSAVSILLPAISQDTGMSVDTLQWAVTGYSLVGAAVIITSGSLGDVFGRKRIFQLGLLLFVASCVLIGLSTTGGMVIAGRMIQGAAGATILACGLSLLSVANTGQAQLRAVSLWGAAAAVGAAAGPLLGGVLVEVTGWQGLFWVDAVVGVVCIGITAATVTESRDPDRPRSIDIAGTILVALTLAPVILALSKGSEWGWTSLATLGCLAVGIAAGFAFVAVERRVKVPLLDLALLRNRVLVGSTVAILIGAGTINALMYLLSLYFQDPATLGFSPLQAGLATLPATAGLVAVAPLIPGWRPSSVVGPWSVPGSRSPPWDSRSSASTRARGPTRLSCCRCSPLPWAWGCPTGRHRQPRPPRFRPPRSGRLPACRTWPATSGPPSRPPLPRPSSARSSAGRLLPVQNPRKPCPPDSAPPPG